MRLLQRNKRKKFFRFFAKPYLWSETPTRCCSTSPAEKTPPPTALRHSAALTLPASSPQATFSDQDRNDGTTKKSERAVEGSSFFGKLEKKVNLHDDGAERLEVTAGCGGDYDCGTHDGDPWDELDKSGRLKGEGRDRAGSQPSPAHQGFP